MKKAIKIIYRSIIYFPFFIISLLCDSFGNSLLTGIHYISLGCAIIGILYFIRFKNPILLILSFIIGVFCPILLKAVYRASQKEKVKFYNTIYWNSSKHVNKNVNADFSHTNSNASKKQTTNTHFHSQSKWFIGVTDMDSLKKRYRDLVKIYHPDNQNGNTDMISEINSEYHELLRKYS